MPPKHGRKRRLMGKQAAFVADRIAHPTASLTASARAAGYKDNGGSSIRGQAHDNLTLPHIADAITTAQQRAAHAADIDAAYVLSGLRRTVDKRLDAEAASQAAVAQRGLELLGKHLGLFQEQAVADPVAVETLRELRALGAMAREARALASPRETQGQVPGAPRALTAHALPIEERARAREEAEAAQVVEGRVRRLRGDDEALEGEVDAGAGA